MHATLARFRAPFAPSLAVVLASAVAVALLGAALLAPAPTSAAWICERSQVDTNNAVTQLGSVCFAQNFPSDDIANEQCERSICGSFPPDDCPNVCTCTHAIACPSNETEQAPEPAAPTGSLSNPGGPTGPRTTIDSGAFSPLGNTNLQSIIGLVIRRAVGATGVIALVMFIYGGFLWMTAAGSGERVEKAKRVLIWSTLGIILVFSAYALVSAVIGALT